jgi:hypothetical protein
MTLPFDPTTAQTVARDRAAALRRDWLEPLHTSSAWRTGRPTASGPPDATPTEKPACRTTRTPASAS